MTKILDFVDDGRACWARFKMDDGSPIHVSVARTGVIVKKSRMGLMGPKLYSRSDVGQVARTCTNLSMTYEEDLTPQGMESPVLRVFTNAALHCTTAAELTRVLNHAAESMMPSEND